MNPDIKYLFNVVNLASKELKNIKNKVSKNKSKTRKRKFKKTKRKTIKLR